MRSNYIAVWLLMAWYLIKDHLRKHAFLWVGHNGWVLSTAYGLNPTLVDMKARILSTNIDFDEGIGSLDLLQGAAKCFGLGLKPAHTIICEVAAVTCTWKAVAEEVGARRAEITRMASAFEHDDLRGALQL